MRFYNQQHKYYCGIDLHSRRMYVCVFDGLGNKLVHKNIDCEPNEFLELIKPFREDVVVGVECMYCWYWLSNLCAREGICFVIGHAFYMRAIHGAKAKNDKLDSEKIALMLKSGMFPLSYVYDAEMRSTRDLMRRRIFFVRKKAELFTHIQMTHHQYNIASPEKSLAHKGNRKGLTEPFEDVSVQKSLAADMSMIEQYETTIRELEKHIYKNAQGHDPQKLAILLSIPGIGDVLALTILYEIHDINRFPTMQQFASYARLVKPRKESNGKSSGGGGSKIGNAHLKWAFSEGAILFVRQCDSGKKYFKRLEQKHGKAKAYSYMAHKLGRTVYFLLQNGKHCDEKRFLK